LVTAPLVRRVLAAVVGVALLAALAGLVGLWPQGAEQAAAPGGAVYVRAEVSAVAELACPDPETTAGRCVEMTVALADGDATAELTEVLAPSFPTPGIGDRLVLGEVAIDGGEASYYLVDYDRERPLLLLLALFVGAVLALGRFRGFGALAGLVLSVGVVVGFLLPAISEGADPLAAAMVTAVVVATAALFLAHGVTVTTAVALVGTLCSLAITGLLASLFIGFAHLTGVISEEGAYLDIAGGSVQVGGLLLAGIIVGSLGVLDDVTVTQVAAVAELRRARPHGSFADVFRPAMRIGRDHVSSTVNTLVLAYVGASLPLLLVLSGTTRSAREVLTGEVFATEIVRALVGSIGLVSAVPITTALAAWALSPRRSRDVAAVA
jgi:uncharacterized membrane protein